MTLNKENKVLYLLYFDRIKVWLILTAGQPAYACYMPVQYAKF